MNPGKRFKLLFAFLLPSVLIPGTLPGQAQEGEYDWMWMEKSEPEWYGPTEGVLADALQSDMHEVEEIVFAVRANGRGWHWYENAGYVIDNPNAWKYGGKGGHDLHLRGRRLEHPPDQLRSRA